MDENKTAVAQACLHGAETNTMTFPQIVGRLMEEGFEGYTVDFRRETAAYYLSDGDNVELSMHKIETLIAANFDASTIQNAIREAQQLLPGYTYKGFCKKAAAAGCAGYIVSFSGRRVLYFGRTAETHEEHFPN